MCLLKNQISGLKRDFERFNEVLIDSIKNEVIECENLLIDYFMEPVCSYSHKLAALVYKGICIKVIDQVITIKFISSKLNKLRELHQCCYNNL